ncbi:MAG: ATP-dependent zinc metalloprotease FtsH [Candidatus Roizmanbacteria bacterium]
MDKKSSRTKKGQNNQEKKSKIVEIKLSFKHLFIILFLTLFVISAVISSQEANPLVPEKPISQLIKDIKDKKVKKIEINGNKITAKYINKKSISYNKEEGEGFIKIIQDSGIKPESLDIEVKNGDTTALVVNALLQIIPTILIIGFFIFLFKQARGAQESVFSFGQSKAKRFSKEMPKIRFADVAGVDEAKRELEEIVDFLKNPKKYAKLGARPPKGALLVGPAGTGKTLLAKATAGESNVPFFSIAGSEFMEMLVGIGAARVRDLFATAKKQAPAIIFIDEIDAIGRARATGTMQGHDEREQTLNQILVEMDGFEPNDRVIVLAATNRGDLLDPALQRPGRFDRRIVLDYPDLKGREEIIKIHARNKPFAKNLDWQKIAKRTVGFSGADLENMLNEAAIAAARNEQVVIENDDLEEAATKVKLGPEKRRLQTDMDKKITAYHEAGHAIVTHFQPEMDPVHRISIISRGMALGFTLVPPSRDRLHQTKSQLLRQLATMMGGRAAEDLIFDEITTGAANDFDQATRIARAMVMEFGMSDLGPINYGDSFDVTQWSRGWMSQTISDSTLALIDKETKKIVEVGYVKAVEILKAHRKELDKVAEALIQKESLDDEEFLKLVGEKIV